MYNTFDVGAKLVYDRMEREPRLVDAEVRRARIDDLPTDIYLDQRRCCNLRVVQTERVD